MLAAARYGMNLCPVLRLVGFTPEILERIYYCDAFELTDGSSFKFKSDPDLHEPCLLKYADIGKYVLLLPAFPDARTFHCLHPLVIHEALELLNKELMAKCRRTQTCFNDY